MITKEKLEIYLKYSKDIDYFAFSGSKSDKSKIDDNDWSKIDDLIMSLGLIRKGNASISYKQKINDELIKICDNKETIAKLKEIEYSEEMMQMNKNSKSKDNWLTKLKKWFSFK